MEQLCSRASSPTCSTVRAPMPRGGLLMMRVRRRSSLGEEITLKYASTSLTSARSKKRVPPMMRYGMPLRLKAYSNWLDWAFMR